MILGITGTLGAGKGTVVEYLVKEKGFTHYSARDVWNEEIARRGWVSNRDNMVIVANELRAEHGPGFFARRAIEKAGEEGKKDAVIESIRSIGEAQEIKSNGGVMWAVDADIHTRYGRIHKRASETDQVTFEKFVEDEQKEFANTDPAKQNISGVMKISDLVLQNNGTQEELFAQVELALSKAGI
jgi:dephospho-CoA kinase